MNSANVIITTDLKNPKELGLHYRLVCMTGPNKGKVYFLTGKRIILGRGEKADIQILDVKISREHAEISFINNNYIISDLSNQNGIIINDKKILQHSLRENEKIVIGQTVLKYNVIFVKEEKKDLALHDDNVIVLNPNDHKKNVSLKPKLDFKNAVASSDEDNPSPAKEQKSTNKVFILIIVIGGIIFITMGDDKNNAPQKTKSASENSFDLESESSNVKKGIGKEDPEVKKKFEMLIHSGRREFREGNYFRAMEEFRRADLLIPGSGMAGFLMSRAKQRLDEDVVKNFDKANKDLDAKKFQSAINSLCGVMQLLQKYPEDERYKSAEEKIRALEVELVMEKGEIKCFEEKSTGAKN
jgi:pSer/pThr/pTyr-binding forkhead associated (FHA) protein